MTNPSQDNCRSNNYSVYVFSFLGVEFGCKNFLLTFSFFVLFVSFFVISEDKSKGNFNVKDFTVNTLIPS